MTDLKRRIETTLEEIEPTELYRIKKVSDMTGYSAKTIYNRIDEGVFNPKVINGVKFLTTDQVRMLLEEQLNKLKRKENLKRLKESKAIKDK